MTNRLSPFRLKKRDWKDCRLPFLVLIPKKKHLFPLDLELTGNGIVKWLERRVIPKNRQFVDEILKTLGLALTTQKVLLMFVWGFLLMTANGSLTKALTENLPTITYITAAFQRRFRLLHIPVPAEATKLLTLPQRSE